MDETPNFECSQLQVNKEKLQPIAVQLADKLARFPELRQLAQRAFITYLKSVSKEKDKEIFDVMKLGIEEFSASLGLPLTPKIRFLNGKSIAKSSSKVDSATGVGGFAAENLLETPGVAESESSDDESDNDLLGKESFVEPKQQIPDIEAAVPATRVLKKKKLKINVNRPTGKRVVFDEEGNDLPPLAAIAERGGGSTSTIDEDKVLERYKKEREKLNEADKEDKLHVRQLLKEKRMKKKAKLKRGMPEEDEDDDVSDSDGERIAPRPNKKSKLYFNSDSDVEEKEMIPKQDKISLEEQEALALKLLGSMHS